MENQRSSLSDDQSLGKWDTYNNGFKKEKKKMGYRKGKPEPGPVHLALASQLDRVKNPDPPLASRPQQGDLALSSPPLPLIQLGVGVAPSQGPALNSYFLVSPVTPRLLNEIRHFLTTL